MQSRTMMGFESPGDKRVGIKVGDWNAMKLALWRSALALEIAEKQAHEIVERCRHADDCPGAEDDSEPCLPECPDREQRMSALVIFAATKQLMPNISARKPDEPYYAPSREYFSEIVAQLVAAQAKLEALRESGVEVSPPEFEALELPAAKPPAQSEE